ncbi:FG-GAP repeat domain-containing protein [Nocardioides sp.]|uniref:FG-GAP repeat domain-containing protein n=1 Tax=Nocardioides sp. TaxID=35761 RepID=UPI003529876A
MLTPQRASAPSSLRARTPAAAAVAALALPVALWAATASGPPAASTPARVSVPAAAATTTAAAATAGCADDGGTAPVAKPRFVRRINTGETGWFSSPGLVDLDHDGKREIVAPFYSTFVYDARGHRLGRGRATAGRVYAPSVTTDLEGDGIPDIVVGGNNGTVAAYEFRGHRLVKKWKASVCSGGQCPEVRGMAAADLDGNGRVEIVVTTTNTSSKGAQVFVLNAKGKRFQPQDGHSPAWPRYNRLRGKGNDLTFNKVGNHGYGAYGENVGIGNLDDDPELEIVTTFDNHQINVFNLDGTSVLASPWFTNRDSSALGRRMGWGQFIRWLSPKVERRHYHLHTGTWPHPSRQAWLQWTASPQSVADLDGDGRNEVIGLPNVELHVPYRTQGYVFMALDGAYGDGSRSARRHAGFEDLRLTAKPAYRGSGDWYPPSGIPAPTVVDLRGDDRPEIVAAVPGGKVYAVGPSGKRLWSYSYASRLSKRFASEVVAADLNRDGTPELVFGTYSLKKGAARLVVLRADGKRLYSLKLRHQTRNGNGIGVAAAPSIADLGGNGTLEIVLTTIDHGIDVYTVPGSGTACLPWPTGRGNPLRNGMGPATAS